MPHPDAGGHQPDCQLPVLLCSLGCLCWCSIMHSTCKPHGPALQGRVSRHATYPEISSMMLSGVLMGLGLHEKPPPWHVT